jgi:hypothetical protein
LRPTINPTSNLTAQLIRRKTLETCNTFISDIDAFNEQFVALRRTLTVLEQDLESGKEIVLQEFSAQAEELAKRIPSADILCAVNEESSGKSNTNEGDKMVAEEKNIPEDVPIQDPESWAAMFSQFLRYLAKEITDTFNGFACIFLESYCNSVTPVFLPKTR